MLYFIVNPASGGGLALRAEEAVRAELERLGKPARFLRSHQPGEGTALAAQAAREQDCDTVVAIGGDGFTWEVAGGLMDTGVPLGIIPGGTGNDFIKAVGIPKEPLAALHYILEKAPRPVDMGLVNGRPFLNVCGTGFDVMVLDHAERFKTRFKGLVPYMLGLISAIAGYRPVHIRLTRDGVTQEQDALMCAVANGQYIGGGIPICPAANPADGKLDVVVLNHVPRWKIPFYLPGLMGKRVLRFGITTHHLAERVEIAAEQMRLQMDGEIEAMNQAVFSILPGRLLLHW